MEFFVDLMENSELNDTVPNYAGCYDCDCNCDSCPLGGCY